MVLAKCVICGTMFEKTCSKKCCSIECSKSLDRIRNEKYRETRKEKIKIAKDKWYKDNKEKVKDRSKKYYEKNIDKIKVQKKKYEEKNKEKTKIRSKKYRETHKDEIKIVKDKWYKDNKEKVRENKRKYYEANKEKTRIRDKKYYNDNKEKISSRGKKYYKQNQIKIISRAQKYYKQNQDRLKIKGRQYYKKSKKNICIVCGEAAPDQFCSKKCMGISWSGENHRAWNGGPKPYDKNWNERFRKSIRNRDNNICMRCRRPREIFTRALSVHHIDGNPQNTIEKNCISLCTSCHSIVEQSGKKIEVFQPLFQKILSKLYGYKYKEELK